MFFVQLQASNQPNVQNTTQQSVVAMPCMLKIIATTQLPDVSCNLLKNVKTDTAIRPIAMSSESFL